MSILLQFIDIQHEYNGVSKQKKDIKLTDVAYHVLEMVLYCIMDELKKFYYSSKQQ